MFAFAANGFCLSDTITKCDAKVANYQISKAKSGKMPGRLTNDIITKSGAGLTIYQSAKHKAKCLSVTTADAWLLRP